MGLKSSQNKTYASTNKRVQIKGNSNFDIPEYTAYTVDKGKQFHHKAVIENQHE